MNEIITKHRGYIAPVVVPENHVLGDGNHPEVVIQPDHNWQPWLPPQEIQDRPNVSTYNCTAYGTLHVLETLIAKQYNEYNDYSERYTGIMAGTTPPGNDPQTVIQNIRKVAGLIPEADLPFNDAITRVEDYYSPKPMIEPYLSTGEAWLGKYSVGHDYVFTAIHTPKDRTERMMRALLYSPLAAGVYAWVKEGDYYVRPQGAIDTHWIMIFNYTENVCWHVFDSDAMAIKYLAWDFGFETVKRYTIDKIAQPIVQKEIPLMLRLIRYLRAFLGMLTKQTFA